MSAAYADGVKDNLPDSVRPVPPPGLTLPDGVRADLQSGVNALGQEIESLRVVLKTKPALLELLPDVQVFHKAVHDALAYNVFFKTNEFKVTAKSLLALGMDRARSLRDGQAPWNTATGLVVRGYVSRIDGSVQPYGLVVPASYLPGTAHSHRLDFWCHGRGETLSELSFIEGRLKSPGEFAPPNAFVLHLYGRYCCANKFAGEMDLFEALADVRKHYPIDENRLVVRGFSMGGAACWQFATHFAGMFAAAAPGAGFSETADFLKVFQNELVQPPWWEQKLWHWYDATDYAVNLFNCPTVAYSGEIDKQKQAAEMMAKALAAEGMALTHIIGPQTAHKYHPDAKEEINRRVDAIASRGRDPVPDKVRFTTWTLRYNQMKWVTVDGLEKHWERTRVDAELDTARSLVRLKTENVTGLTLSMAPGTCPFDNSRQVTVIMDGRELQAPVPGTDRSWTAPFHKDGRRWKSGPIPDSGELRKRPGLQGPIDDAFMDRFVMVRPTGQPLNEKIGAWASAEMAHAVEHWRKQFRGQARVVNDDSVSDDDIRSSHLVLWGDRASNRLLAKLADKLPIRWSAEGVVVGKQQFSAAHHAPVMVFPNPLNPQRYVVLNSGFTFREYDYLSNARQTPKLPDWAVVDVNVPVSSRAPGGIVAAGFFDEHWRLPGR